MNEGKGQMSDAKILRYKARQALEASKLPACRPESILGGSGTGAACVICSEPVRPQELGYELEFAGDGENPGVRTYPTHIPCFAAWEHERQNFQESSAVSAALPNDGVDGTIAGRGGSTTHRRD